MAGERDFRGTYIDHDNNIGVTVGRTRLNYLKLNNINAIKVGRKMLC